MERSHTQDATVVANGGDVAPLVAGKAGAGQKRKVLGEINPNVSDRQTRSKPNGAKAAAAAPAHADKHSVEAEVAAVPRSAPIQIPSLQVQDESEPDSTLSDSPKPSPFTFSADGTTEGAPPPVPEEFDIDSCDREDEYAVTEYLPEIYHNLRLREADSMVNPDYMTKQADITDKMRVILTDWLVEVHLKFKLRHETLYLCFQLMDRFLQDNPVIRQRLQLVGVTAMMLASKYEEIYPPEMRDFIYICDNAYTKKQILEMEQLLLEKLKFCISLPTPWSFMLRFCRAAGKEKDLKFVNVVNYLIDLAQIDYKMLKYSPSMLVASSVALANQIIPGNDKWNESLKFHTQYELENLTECMGDLLPLVDQAFQTSTEPQQKFRAVFKKYSHAKFQEVASLPYSHVDLDL